jgi:hypothetical protein
LLDKSDDKNFSRMIAIKLGVQALDLEEVKRRLMDVGLIDDLFQPVGWSKHQYFSDNLPKGCGNTGLQRKKRQ